MSQNEDDDAEEIMVASKPVVVKKTGRDGEKPLDNHDNFITMGIEGLRQLNWKMYGLLFIIFILITSDIFIDRILSRFKGAVSGTEATSYGTIIQGIMLVLFYMIIEFICKNKYI